MSTRYRRTRQNGSGCLLLGLLPLTALLAACATTSPDSTPVAAPRIPQPPASLMTPVEPESYLERAQQSIEAWRKRLTDSATK